MSSKKGIYIFTLIGLLLGVTLDSLIRHENTTLFYYAFICIFSLLYALTYNEKNLIRLIASSFVTAFLLSLPLLPLNLDYNTALNIEHWLAFLSAFPVFVYIGHSFHYAYHHDNTWRVNYSSLFAAVWNTLPLLFVASLFSSMANLLILMGAFIFQTVGNNFLWNLYTTNQHFWLISNTTLFFIGLGIGQQNIKIIYNLRFLLLKMMSYLLPVLALISTVYFILYWSHFLSHGTENINPLFILLPLVALGIIFFNAYFQDGNTETGAPRWLKLSLRIYRVVLLMLVLLMCYHILNNNSLDINIFLYLLVTVFYCLTYAITAWFPEQKEQEGVRAGNIATALFFIVALFLLNLPYMPIAFNVGTQTNTVSTIQINQQPAVNH